MTAPHFRRIILAAALAAAPLSFAAAQIPGSAMPAPNWPISTREHVDLWLHVFAMISDDSTRVPLFRRAYREQLTAARQRNRITTDLDVNRDVLSARLKENPALLGAQFVALAFVNGPDLESALDAFVKADGSARGARDQEAAARISYLAGVFPAREDRDFARRLLLSMRSEREKFFSSWWLAATNGRNRTRVAVDSLWQREYRPRLQGFLNRTQQTNGQLILSIVLEGEGRTVNGGKQRTAVAVGLPESPERAMDAIFAAAHELIGPLASSAVDDNTTPAEKRSGEAERLSGAALVRGGALLCARLSPSLAEAYARFYLRVAGVAAEGDLMNVFATTFPLPRGLLDSIERQINIAFGGI